MPHTFRKLLSCCTAALCIFTAASALSLFLALRLEYDNGIRHFILGAVWPTVSVILCLIGVLIAAVLAIGALRTKADAVPSRNASSAVFASTLLGFLLFASFILDIRALSDAGLTWFARILPALGGLSSFYFLALAIRKENSAPSPMHAALSLLPILYAFLSVLNTFFDEAYAMNAPVKAYGLMMYLSMALFFTAEARLTLGRQKTASYCLFAGLCLTLCGTVGAAKLIIVLVTPAYGFSLMECAASLVCALYAAVRLFSLDDIPAELPEEQEEQKEPEEQQEPEKPEEQQKQEKTDEAL